MRHKEVRGSQGYYQKIHPITKKSLHIQRYEGEEPRLTSTLSALGQAANRWESAAVAVWQHLHWGHRHRHLGPYGRRYRRLRKRCMWLASLCGEARTMNDLGRGTGGVDQMQMGVITGVVTDRRYSLLQDGLVVPGSNGL